MVPLCSWVRHRTLNAQCQASTLAALPPLVCESTQWIIISGTGPTIVAVDILVFVWQQLHSLNRVLNQL